MTDSFSFHDAFKALTGHPPFPWQEKLFNEWFMQGKIPSSCNLPTGLGKTNVIAVWLIALARTKGKLPRRLVYVVNRRTVVDQATDEARKLRDNLDKAGLTRPLQELCAFDHAIPLAISTLRGQFADNGEWAADPARPAIIVGTVDMIGSRLLFSGYGIGFKRKPLHAGFLGQDVLLVHDEAHLEPAFSKLLWKIEREQRRDEKPILNLGRSLYVMELSATSRVEPSGDRDIAVENRPNPCKHPLELDGDDRNEQVVKDRLYAVKHLKLQPVEGSGKNAMAETVAKYAGAYDCKKCRVLIYVRSPDTALVVAEFLRKKLKLGEEEARQRIGLLTGTLRGYERDKLAESDLFRAFASDPNRRRQLDRTLYLVSTSAGEVGVDLDADHLVCDLTTLDSMIQRLGRVNRLGGKDRVAEIAVVYDTDQKREKSAPKKPKEASPLDEAIARTREVLQSIVDNGGYVSPDALRQVLEGQEVKDAFSPVPKMVPATDILLDAWALTSIRDDMPGRPEVALYLHGKADDLPQTTITWRVELDLIDADSPDAAKTIQAIFAKHRIRPHETLIVGMTNQRGKWKSRAIAFLEEVAAKRPDLRNTRIAIQFPRHLRLTTVSDLIDNPGPLNADPTLVLPATFGGLDDKGMLSADAIPSEPKTGDAPLASSLDIADHDEYELLRGLPSHRRYLIERTDEGWRASTLPGGKPLPESLDPSYDKSTQLINDLRGADSQYPLRVRLVQPVAFDKEGDPIRSLVALSAIRKRPPKEEQLLNDHVGEVDKEARQLACKLELCEPFRAALFFAAKWHDEGKNASIWQRYIGGTDPNQPLGKSAKWCDPRKLGGYRHEVGSLLRIEYPDRHHTACVLPDDPDTRDLALHLIAAHHGYARPHFRHALDNDFTTQQCDDIHTSAIQRFARLQRKYGRWGLAYLESLLRAVDWAVSGDGDADDDLEETNGANA